MIRTFYVVMIGLAWPGCGSTEIGDAVVHCADICDALVTTCALESFPDLEGCVAGCLYAADRGADVESQLACIGLAECDLFAIIECEHDFG